MKRFAIRILTFIVFLSGMSFAFFYFLQIFVEHDEFYKIDPETTGIIVGDSHAETAYNDSIIPGIQNFAESGDIYFYTYQRTKRIVEENPQIKTVYLEFNNGQLLPTMDHYIWENEHVVEKYRKYCTEMTYEEQFMFLKHNFRDVINARILRADKDISLLMHDENRDFNRYEWGAYRVITHNGEDEINLLDPLVDHKMDTIITRATLYNMDDLFHKLVLYKNNKVEVRLYPEDYSFQHPQFFEVRAHLQKTPPDTGFIDLPELNIEYMKKTITLCQDHGLEVKLMRTPFHAGYSGALNEKTFQHLLENDFADIPFYDFRDFPLDPDDFSDVHHLNEKGALKFSTYFNQFLESKESLRHRYIFKSED